MSAARTLILGFALLGVFSWVAVSEGQTPSPGAAAQSSRSITLTPYGNQPFMVRTSPDAAQKQSIQLAQQYIKATKEDEKKGIKKKLTEILNQQFDQRIQQQQKELEELEKQIASLKAVLKKRTDAKTTIVERRIDQLVQEAEGLGWNNPSGPHTPTPFGGFSGGFGGFSGGGGISAPAPRKHAP